MISKSQRLIITGLALVFLAISFGNIFLFRQTKQYRDDAEATLVENNRVLSDINYVASLNDAISRGFATQPQLLRWVDDDHENLLYCDKVRYYQSRDNDSAPAWWLTGTSSHHNVPNYAEGGETIYYHPYHDKDGNLHVESYQLVQIFGRVYSREIEYEPIPDSVKLDYSLTSFSHSQTLDQFLHNNTASISLSNLRIPLTGADEREVTVYATDENVIVSEHDCPCTVCGCGDACCCE